MGVVAHMDSKNTPLKGTINRTKPYIQYIQSMHIGHNWTHPLFCFYFDHFIICLIACKYFIKMMQSMNGFREYEKDETTDETDNFVESGTFLTIRTQNFQSENRS